MDVHRDTEFVASHAWANDLWSPSLPLWWRACWARVFAHPIVSLHLVFVRIENHCPNSIPPILRSGLQICWRLDLLRRRPMHIRLLLYTTIINTNRSKTSINYESNTKKFPLLSYPLPFFPLDLLLVEWTKMHTSSGFWTWRAFLVEHGIDSTLLFVMGGGLLVSFLSYEFVPGYNLLLVCIIYILWQSCIVSSNFLLYWSERDAIYWIERTYPFLFVLFFFISFSPTTEENKSTKLPLIVAKRQQRTNNQIII